MLPAAMSSVEKVCLSCLPPVFLFKSRLILVLVSASAAETVRRVGDRDSLGDEDPGGLCSLASSESSKALALASWWPSCPAKVVRVLLRVLLRMFRRRCLANPFSGS